MGGGQVRSWLCADGRSSLLRASSGTNVFLSCVLCPCKFSVVTAARVGGAGEGANDATRSLTFDRQLEGVLSTGSPWTMDVSRLSSCACTVNLHLKRSQI